MARSTVGHADSSSMQVACRFPLPVTGGGLRLALLGEADWIPIAIVETPFGNRDPIGLTLAPAHDIMVVIKHPASNGQ
ncbi:MAG: hypothetical protein LQ348_007156 [Seirophora lacunosa]|nr:MAG: hypothetical protein LQ348_007156 [Seirophora lacunosa]